MGSHLGICTGENSYSVEEKEHLQKLADQYGKRIVILEHIRILGNGLELACNGGSCGEILFKKEINSICI